MLDKRMVEGVGMRCEECKRMLRNSINTPDAYCIWCCDPIIEEY